MVCLSTPSLVLLMRKYLLSVLLLTVLTTLLAKTEFYHWEYGGNKYTIEAQLSEDTYRFYRNRSRDRDYGFYATDPFDDKLIKNFAQSMGRLSRKNDLTALDELYLVIAFIQALPYTTDIVTTGVGEYPRFPFETLFENGGDCEDTAILAAAILTEMGYDSVLIQLEDHMAVAIHFKEGTGDYYSLEGKRYYYLETTGNDWVLGEIPTEYQGQSAKPLPLVYEPSVSLKAGVETEFYDDPDDREVKITVSVDVTNIGSADARGLQLYIYIDSDESDKVYDQYVSPRYDLDVEDDMTVIKSDLKAYKGKEYRIVIEAVYHGLLIGELTGDWERVGK